MQYNIILGIAACLILLILSFITDYIEVKYMVDNLQKEMARQSEAVAEHQKYLEELSLQIMKTVATAIDEKEDHNSGHSGRVAIYSLKVGRALGLKEEELRSLEIAAMLHDIGNTGISESILNKKDILTEGEIALLRSHTTIGAEIIRKTTSMKDSELVARYHHENYDGSGYPEKLAGKDIPLPARIVHIADAYDAMTTGRNYQNRMAPELIRRELKHGRGSQFDPELLDIFLELVDNGTMKDALEQAEESRGQGDSPETASSYSLMKNIILDAGRDRPEGNIDYLTGLMSRSSGEPEIRTAIHENDGCLAFVDLDNLKRVNDTLGHRFGDRALKLLSKCLKNMQGDNILCRYGEDEFLCYFKGTDHDAAEERIKDLMRLFDGEKEDIYDYVTLSIGLCENKAGGSFSDNSSKADQALYFVKHNGKNGYHFYKSRISDEIDDMQVDMSMVAESLRNSGDYTGSLSLEMREFAQLYQYLCKQRARSGYESQLVMVSLHLSSDVDAKEQEDYMSILEDQIQKTVRTTDIISRFSPRQFLLIIAGADQRHAHLVTERIAESFYDSCPNQNYWLSFAAADDKK